MNSPTVAGGATRVGNFSEQNLSRTGEINLSAVTAAR